jgi:hypothetical protein
MEHGRKEADWSPSGQGEAGKQEEEQEQRDKTHHMLRMHHAQTLWVYWALIIAGFWTLLSPLTFGYSDGMVEPAGGRDVWLSPSARAMAMTVCDLLSGFLLIVFGWRSLRPNRPVSLWICCFIGIWLSFAPLIFWAPTGAAYLNGTLVGLLVMSLSVLIPGMPNMMAYMQKGPDTPPGWSYNPSSWPQRWILIVLGFAGMVTSRYLAAYQMGYIDTAWDPFFGEGSRQVLESNMSRAWPISDAGLGAFSYTLEFLMGFMGGKARWRTMPWMVTLFGILVIPLGLTHIFLVISQPVMVGAWCSLCLLAALFMLPMIPLEADEVVAMGQFLARKKREGDPFWRTFWKGGTVEGGGMDERSPELLDLPEKPVAVIGSSFWGMSHPWTLWASAALGIWLMFSPLVFGSDKPAANLDHLGGALVFTFSILALGEVLRGARLVNLLIGLALVSVPWFLGGATLGSQANDVITGLLILGLGLPRGPKRESYAGWDRFVR